jgi:hypothetical protein
MKKLFTFLSVLLAVVFQSIAQPQSFSYQGAARAADGSALTSRNINLRISIKETAGAANNLYQEVHQALTNNIGVFHIEIGKGDPITSTFANINWRGDRFMKVEMDPNGGGAFVDMGTTQLLSVPFALRAASASSSDDWMTVSGKLIPQSENGVLIGTGLEVGVAGRSFSQVKSGRTLLPNSGNASLDAEFTIPNCIPNRLQGGVIQNIKNIVLTPENSAPGDFSIMLRSFSMNEASNELTVRVRIRRLDVATGWSLPITVNWVLFEPK